VRALVGFVIRLVAYALVLGVVSRIAASLWVQYGLDGSIQLQPLHDIGLEVLVIAPLPLALFGIGGLRGAALFIAAFLAGVALTAPFAIARFTGL
jgi:hypothetical protein